MEIRDIPLMILCGGKGTRLRDVTELLPKPMVSIGDQPIVWHIMKTYASFGVRRFILCLGYKKEAFADYFMNYHSRMNDFTVQLGNESKITWQTECPEKDWEVTLAGTGLSSMTGCRVFRASKYLQPGEKEFFLTYGDGVADVDLEALLALHRKTGKMLTITAVHPESRWGLLDLKGDSVAGFQEKPTVGGDYINGGFMVMKREFVEKYLRDDPTLTLEQIPMRSAAVDGNMAAYRHEGYWQCMDNQREYLLLNELWNSSKAPWTKYWK